MCGIDGFAWRPDETPPRDLLSRMTQRMHHRGPDAQGICEVAHVGLGHRRLKIIDLSEAANQPMTSQDGQLSIVFNGEIYNYRELRSRLEELGHSFRTASDTEVIIEAFKRWGTECFRMLNGIFALALCDTRSGRPVFHLARDRFGTKPLFFAHREGRLAFASELKPLLDVPWISHDVDRDVLFHYLKFSHVPTPRSILRDVRQVRPGTWVRFDNGDAREETYWDPAEMTRAAPAPGRTESDWTDELDALLRRVVRRQMVSDVPLGCLLSGGIDSSLLAMAGVAANPALKTFSIGYKEAEFDETPFAREVAQAFGTQHHELIVGPADMLALVREVPVHFDQPLADPTALPTMLVSRFARQQVTVVMSGDGGDELFFGYTFQRALHQLAAISWLPGPLRRGACAALDAALAAIPGGPGPQAQKLRKALQILQFANEGEMFAYFIGTIGPMPLGRLAGLLADPPLRTPPMLAEILSGLGSVSRDQKIEQVFLRSFLPDTVLAKTDRATMAYGLEGRVPFLDDEMVEFSSRLPFDLKLKGTVMKYLPRRLLERHLPGRISKRRKQGFSVPMRDWLRRELRPLLEEYLDEARLRREGYFHPAHVRALVKEHVGARANHQHVLWSLISFQMWKEHYRI